MYYIITNNKEIYDFAKKKGAKVLSTNESIIIKNDKVDKSSRKHSDEDKEFELDVIDNFFNRFPEINKNTLGYRSVKYILKNKIRITIDTRYTVYEQLAKEFNKSVSSIVAGITCLFKNVYEVYEYSREQCEHKELFDEIRKNPKARYRGEYAAEFIRLCSEYINKNCLENENKLDSNVIDAFFGKFAYANKNTLGYECVKYILENNIYCAGNYGKTVYPILTKKFKTKVRFIKQSMTYFLNNCRYNIRFGMPEDFKKFYEQYNSVYVKRTVEENNFAFISLCRNYLNSIY